MTCMEINMFFSTVLQWAQALAKDEVLLFQSGFSQPLPAENAAGTGDGCTKSNKSQNKSGNLPGGACGTRDLHYTKYILGTHLVKENACGVHFLENLFFQGFPIRRCYPLQF